MDATIENKRKLAREKELKSIRRNKIKYIIISILSIITVLTLWELAVKFQWVDTRFLESPLDVLKVIAEKITTKEPDGAVLFEHILSSAVVVWLGFLFSAIIGIPLGLFMGWYKPIDRLVRPIFELVRPIPALAWIPIVLLFFGVSVQGRAVIIFFGSFVLVVINTYTGIKSANPVLINVAKVCGASNFMTFYRIGIPSAMPMIFAGLRSAIASSWATVVAAEMLGTSMGLGYLIQFGRSVSSVSIIIAGIMVIGVCGWISTQIVALVEKRVLKWRPEQHEK